MLLTGIRTCDPLLYGVTPTIENTGQGGQNLFELHFKTLMANIVLIYQSITKQRPAHFSLKNQITNDLGFAASHSVCYNYSALTAAQKQQQTRQRTRLAVS